MKKKDRTLYSQKNIRRLKRWERLLVKPVAEAIQKQQSAIASVLRERGPQAAIDAANDIIMIDGMSQAVRRIYLLVGLSTARRTLREVNQSAKEPEKKAGFGFDEEWTKSILEYFRLYLLSKAVLPISATIRAKILATLNQGIAEGWGIDRMAFEIEGAGFRLARARLIVRTELLKAQFYGEELGKHAADFETVEEWISAHDHRVRSSHRKVDGETIESGGRFKVDRIRNKVVIGFDMMKGPGDPEASIENIANCRCVRAVRAARDEKGRIIRKRNKSNISVILPGQFIRNVEPVTI